MAPRGVGAVMRRGVWSLVDQGVYAFSNLLLALLVARETSAEQFGRFALTFALYSLLLGVSRAIANQVFAIESSAADPAAARRHAAGGSALALVFGAVGTALVAPVALVLIGAVPIVWVLLLGIPGLLLQDFWRNALLARKRAGAAVVNDVAWLVVQVGLLAVLATLGGLSATGVIATWVAAGWFAALLGGVQFGARPALRAAAGHLRASHQLSSWMALEALVLLGATQVCFFLIAFIGTEADVGAIRGAMTLFGPITVVTFGIGTFVLPELMRHPVHGRRARRFVLGVGGGLAVASLVWGVALMSLPHSWGVRLLGDTWAGTTQVLPWMTLWLIGTSFAGAPRVVLRSWSATRATFGAYSAVALTTAGLVAVGATSGGLTGAALGFAAGTVVTAPVWIVLLVRADRTTRTRRSRALGDTFPSPVRRESRSNSSTNGPTSAVRDP